MNPMHNKYLKNIVLIGDSNLQRAELLKRIIEENFAATVFSFDSFEELQEAIEIHNPKLILIANDLVFYKNVLIEPQTQVYFLTLGNKHQRYKLACITPNNHEPILENLLPPPTYIHVPLLPLTDKQQEQIGTELGSLLPKPPKPPKILLEDSSSLRQQVRGLSIEHNLTEGEKILSEIILQFFDCEEAEITSLGQGLSGASVFRFCPKKNGEMLGEFVLKLSSTKDFWKIKQEVERYEAAKAYLGIENYKTHYAVMREPVIQPEIEKYIVNHSSGWWAVCYDFLGGPKFGELIDLETAFIAASRTIEEKTANTRFQIGDTNPSTVDACRFLIWETALDWLCKNWYQKAGLVKRDFSNVWNSENSRDDQYVTFPPYRLSGKSKSFILSFLDSRATTLGERLIPNWENHRSRVWSFIDKSESLTGINLLDASIPFVLSPAHGDLNANNLLLWLAEANHPFLIDFPFFQPSGHALQDFARLEVEIKLSLMDKQTESNALPALDYTYTQIDLWIELEGHLLSDKWQEGLNIWKSNGYKDNVESCLKLIQIVRNKAENVQRQSLDSLPPTEFLNEYLPALLFHTLRAIGYPTLSIFKRLYSVYSASSILSNPILITKSS
jgi:hypothetical protein